jgi:hypothetical protein
MTRAGTVPGSSRRMFVRALKKLSVHAAALPDPIPMDCVLSVFDDAIAPEEITRRGDLNTDEELQVLAGRDERGYFLDYYRVDNDNDGQTSRHGRIRGDGTVEPLENFEGQWGRQTFPDDPAKTEAELQRMMAHNTRVKALLREKGFL